MATLGDTSEPTNSAEAWVGSNYSMHAHVLIFPSGGPWRVLTVGAWVAGYGTNTPFRHVVWDGSSGAVIAYSTADLTAIARSFSASGSDLYTSNVYADGPGLTPLVVSGGATVIVGVQRQEASYGLFFGKRSTGSHRDKIAASYLDDMASNTTHSTGAMGAYLTYEAANSLPSAPTLTSPATGATITDTTPPLAFTHNDPDGDAIVSYDLQVDSTTGNGVTPDWASLAFESVSATTDDGGAIGGDNTIVKSTSALTRGGWYAWRARTNDGAGDGAWSSPRWFYLNALPTVGTRTPGASGFAYIHNLAELAVWSAVSAAAKPRLQFVYNDPDGHASQSYRVRVYKAASGGAAVFDSGVVPAVVAAGATITADINHGLANADGPKAATNIIQNGSSSDANNYTTASVTMKAGRLYLLAVENSKGSGTADAVSSVTGGAGVPTFTSRSTTPYNGNLNRVTILSAVPTTDYTGTLTINFGGVTQTGAVWSLDELTGIDTTTTDGVVQQAVGTGNSGTALATLGAFASAANPTYGAAGHAAATASAPGSGFTEKADQTQATPAQALATEWRTDSDTSVDITFTSAQWGMCAVELQSAERWWTVEVVDSQGESSGESSRTAFKVRYGQGRYAFNAGAGSSAWSFTPASVPGGTQSAFAYRSSTDGNGAGASAWFANIASVPIQAWIEVVVRLATYTVGTNPTLTDMLFSYLGNATTPDRWTGTPGAEWALVTDQRRFGARAIKCTVVAGTGGNRYIYPFRKTTGDDIAVSKNTQYTFSAYVKTPTPLTGGDLRLAVSRTPSSTDFITPDVASPVVTDTSAYPDGWRRITMTFTTESAETVRPLLLYTRASGVNESFLTDAWKVEEGTVATAWTPGFIGTPVILDSNGIQVDGQAGGILRVRSASGAVTELGPDGLTLDGRLMAPMPAGAITAYGAGTAPTGWLLCDGASYLRADYAVLFGIIGTTFGSVDGTHFNVPDLRQRFPLGKAASGTGSTLGGSGGAIDHTHTSAGHTHPHATTHTHQETVRTSGTTTFIAGGGSTGSALAANVMNATITAGGSGSANLTSADAPGSTDSTTPGATGTANPPFLAVNYIIKT